MSGCPATLTGRHWTANPEGYCPACGGKIAEVKRAPKPVEELLSEDLDSSNIGGRVHLALVEHLLYSLDLLGHAMKCDRIAGCSTCKEADEFLLYFDQVVGR